MARYLFLLAIVLSTVNALDNGLAQTPPMGWLSWQRFRCIVDCDSDPDNCISEKLYREMADRLVDDGYIYYGYKYINIDDCWAAKTRGPNGELRADPKRFPNGIESLASYLHLKGLKLGIYADFGNMTCGGYPGSKYNLAKDAVTFAQWGVDMLKLDGCYTNIDDMDTGYPEMSRYLNLTGRQILFSCSWPAYLVFAGQTPNYQRIAEYCNIWRNYRDIDDTYDSIKDIVNFYIRDEGNFAGVAGPGHFNDPDMLIVGDFGLSLEQQKVQLALWSIMAAPMFMSNDLRKMPSASKQLLLNHFIRLISQDPMGIQGKRIAQLGKMEFWAKPMAPDGKSLAYAFRNLDEGGGPKQVSFQYKDLGLTAPQGYNVSDVFANRFIGQMRPNDWLNVTVNPSGIYLGAAFFGPMDFFPK